MNKVFFKFWGKMFLTLSISVSGVFLYKWLNSSGDFYLSENFHLSGDFLEKQKNHIYSKKLDSGLDLKNNPPIKIYDPKYYETTFLFDDEKEKELYQFISDHTFKLQTQCLHGTGWILDFEIPTDDTYPTTWYIATNLHVISEFKFLTNPYNVHLPLSSNAKYSDFFTNVGKDCKQSFEKGTELTLEKTTIKIGEIVTVKQLTEPNSSGENVEIIDNSKSPNKTEKVTTKLFYHALNFLGERNYKDNRWGKNKQNYHKDFAVLEITFDSEEKAKNITDDFYGKYYKNNDADKKPVNVFSPELMSRVKSHKELWEKEDEFYTGGYPLKSKFDYNAFTDKKTQKKIKTTLHKYNNIKYESDIGVVNTPLLTKHKEPIIGHSADETSFSLVWNNKWTKSWGYSYILDHAGFHSGASGSMFIDKNKNLLGIGRSSNLRWNWTFVDPLMSEGIFDGRKIITPKFDLIRGVEGQHMSYKSQLEKYHPQMNTYLKSINWGKTTSVKTV